MIDARAVVQEHPDVFVEAAYHREENATEPVLLQGRVPSGDAWRETLVVRYKNVDLFVPPESVTKLGPALHAIDEHMPTKTGDGVENDARTAITGWEDRDAALNKLGLALFDAVRTAAIEESEEEIPYGRWTLHHPERPHDFDRRDEGYVILGTDDDACTLSLRYFLNFDGDWHPAYASVDLSPGVLHLARGGIASEHDELGVAAEVVTACVASLRKLVAEIPPPSESPLTPALNAFVELGRACGLGLGFLRPGPNEPS